MAIDTFITCTVDPSASRKTNGAEHVHTIKRATANAGNITIAFDKTAVGSRTIMRTAVQQMLALLDGGSELTA